MVPPLVTAKLEEKSSYVVAFPGDDVFVLLLWLPSSAPVVAQGLESRQQTLPFILG